MLYRGSFRVLPHSYCIASQSSTALFHAYSIQNHHQVLLPSTISPNEIDVIHSPCCFDIHNHRLFLLLHPLEEELLNTAKYIWLKIFHWNLRFFGRHHHRPVRSFLACYFLGTGIRMGNILKKALSLFYSKKLEIVLVGLESR